jgi:hypothetical protein
MAKINTRNRIYRRKNMRGGSFSQEEFQILSSRGLSDDQIETMQTSSIPFNEVIQRMDTIMDQDGYVNPDYIYEQLMSMHTNEAPIDENLMNEMPIEYDDDNSFETQGPMTLDELNTSTDTDMSGYTTDEDRSGGRRRCKKSRKMQTKRKKGKKSRKTRKHKQRGGTCYGRGVGANSYDPNYTIYNTNMLKLFPYRTN